mmetsp:Transcript_6063/g.9159  ORF Transcript_6063/g.9159 Transcript_6063/m.9159 type:complete len:271 (+) Transcript_6063:42-854(+)
MNTKRIHPSGDSPSIHPTPPSTHTPHKTIHSKKSETIQPISPHHITTQLDDSNKRTRLSSMRTIATVMKPIIGRTRRGAKGDLVEPSSLTFYNKMYMQQGRYWRPRGGGLRDCKSYQTKSLREDLITASKARGVVYNTSFKEEDYEAFRKSFQLLMRREDDYGVHVKTLLKSLLRLRIFTCKKEAIKLIRSIPGKYRGMVCSENIIEASTDIHIHQRNKLRRFMKVLPETCEEKGTTWLFGDGFPTPKGSSSRWNTSELKTDSFTAWATK